MLGFLGFGNMGSAILQGLIEAEVLTGKHAVVCDPDPGRRDLARHLGAAIVDSPADLARASDTLLLAVKPQMMQVALDELRPGIRPDTLFVSIAAGISISWLRQRIGGEPRVVRVMPNTPAMCHTGAAGIALGPGCTEADAELVKRIFEAVGIAELVEEAALDAVTAVSGSGPAYFFYLVECLARAGHAQGLSEEAALRLASQTLIGAGRLLQSTGEAAAVLRARVTSKGGTTEAALRQLQLDAFEKVITAAVAAAADRSRELGRAGG